MAPSRRRIIAAGVVGAALLLARRALAATIRWPDRTLPVTDVRSASFVAWLDTLLPGDESAPPASELDLARDFVARATASGQAGRLLESGVRWLDDQARARGAGSFAALTAQQREAVVVLAETSPDRSLPARFFRFTRNEAVTAYYADRRSWAALNYGGPPQPQGFPDFAEPPPGHADGR